MAGTLYVTGNLMMRVITHLFQLSVLGVGKAPHNRIADQLVHLGHPHTHHVDDSLEGHWDTATRNRDWLFGNLGELAHVLE